MKDSMARQKLSEISQRLDKADDVLRIIAKEIDCPYCKHKTLAREIFPMYSSNNTISTMSVYLEKSRNNVLCFTCGNELQWSEKWEIVKGEK